MPTPPTFTTGAVLTAAQMNTIAMHKITSVNMSGTSTTVTNCFTSDYTNYKVIINFTNVSANTFVYLQFSNAGAPDATANYVYATNSVTSAGATSAMSSGSNTALLLGYVGTSNTNSASTLEIFQPKVSGRTYGHSQRWEYDSANFVARSGGFLKDQITAFDGFVVSIGASATMSGTIQVFGYRN